MTARGRYRPSLGVLLGALLLTMAGLLLHQVVLEHRESAAVHPVSVSPADATVASPDFGASLNAWAPAPAQAELEPVCGTGCSPDVIIASCLLLLALVVAALLPRRPSSQSHPTGRTPALSTTGPSVVASRPRQLLCILRT